MGKNVIGLSLSLCIMDMIEGIVDPDNVLFIYTATSADFPIQLEDIAERYGQSYWSQDPELGRKLLFDLWEAGKIIQPKTIKYKPCLDDYDRPYDVPHIADGHWAIQVHRP
jgi:hypothetical protein